MVVPEIPQLHEGLLGLHVKSTDIGEGSFSGNLVCTEFDKLNSVSSTHPGIKFDQPIAALTVKAISVPTGKIVWDARYDLNGKDELLNNQMGGGDEPMWRKVCTPRGAIEEYRIDMQANGMKSGPFRSSITFTSNNGLSAEVPGRSQGFHAYAKLPLVPKGPAIVHVDPSDLNPMKFL